MRKRILVGALALAATVTITALSENGSKAAAAPASTAVPNVARGKYLVTSFGQCGDCHSPHDKTGKEVKGRQLQGSPLMFKPTVPVPGWKMAAPSIAGLNGWTDEQGITFFTTGKLPDGSYANPPMPAFRMNRSDAAAVVAYLKSLR